MDRNDSIEFIKPIFGGDGAGKLDFLGSSVVIGPRHLLTCWHVLEDKSTQKPYPILHLGGEEGPKLIYVRHEPDLALVRCSKAIGSAPATWLDNASLKYWLSIQHGWQATGCRSLRPETAQGHRHQAHSRDDLQVEGGIAPGFSGGALRVRGVGPCIGLVRAGGLFAAASRVFLPAALSAFLSRCSDAPALQHEPWRLDFSEQRRQYLDCRVKDESLFALSRISAAHQWVLVHGGSKDGRCALLHRFVERRQEHGCVPHHFIHRSNVYRSPRDVAANLSAHLRHEFPDALEGTDQHASLGDQLHAIAERVLVPTGRRLVVVVHGLDHLDFDGANAVELCFPTVLPSQVSFVISTEKRAAQSETLGVRKVHWHKLDDESALASTNQARALETRLLRYLGDNIARFHLSVALDMEDDAAAIASHLLGGISCNQALIKCSNAHSAILASTKLDERRSERAIVDIVGEVIPHLYRQGFISQTGDGRLLEIRVPNTTLAELSMANYGNRKARYNSNYQGLTYVPRADELSVGIDGNFEKRMQQIRIHLKMLLVEPENQGRTSEDVDAIINATLKEWATGEAVDEVDQVRYYYLLRQDDVDDGFALALQSRYGELLVAKMTAGLVDDRSVHVGLRNLLEHHFKAGLT